MKNSAKTQTMKNVFFHKRNIIKIIGQLVRGRMFLQLLCLAPKAPAEHIRKLYNGTFIQLPTSVNSSSSYTQTELDKKPTLSLKWKTCMIMEIV